MRFLIESRGFSLLLIILVITGLGLSGLGAAKLIEKVNTANKQSKANIELTKIQTATRQYYRGHADLGLPGTPGSAGPVPVAALGLESKYTHDDWGTAIEYYRGRDTSGDIPGITEVTVDGVEAAGYILSYGPNQVNNSSFLAGTLGVTRSAITCGGDDILLPLSVKAEAIQITNKELHTLSSKSCAYHIAEDTWFDNWSSFLAQFGLGSTYRTDPWDTDYFWDVDHWVSDGADSQPDTTDDIMGPILTAENCPYTTPSNEPIDPFDNLDYWSFGWGSHSLADYNGDSALDVEQTWINFLCQFSLFIFNWDYAAEQGEDTDLEAAWLNADRTLSYDAQIKVAATQPYAAGISFRVRQIGTYVDRYPGYGVSFLQTDDIGSDQIPDNITPGENRTYIVLWYRTDAGCINADMLAYKELAGEEYFFDDIEGDVSDWSGHIGTGSDTDRWVRRGPTSDRYWEIQTSYITNTRNRNLISPYFDLPADGPLTLTFQNRRTGLWGASGGGSDPFGRGLVHIRVDDGEWQQLTVFNSTTGWNSETIDLSAYAGSSNVQLRFRLRYRETGDTVWRIDDVKVEGGFPVDMSTLMVRVEEQDDPDTLYFSDGIHEIYVGDTISQGYWGGIWGDTWTTTVTATVTGITITSGDWSTFDAAGVITVSGTDGNWSTSRALRVDDTDAADLDSFTTGTGRYNYIKVFYSLPYETPAGHTGDTNPYNEDRLGNPRGQANWPPDEGELYTADKDFFTLVEWDWTGGGCTLIGTDTIRDNQFTSPGTGDSFSELELGLHTWGTNGSGSGDDTYFDDFSLQKH